MKVAKVVNSNAQTGATIERQIVKLHPVEAFLKYCSFLKMHNFYMIEPPTVIKVVEETKTISKNKDGKLVPTIELNEIDIDSNVDGLDINYQTLVNSSLSKVEKKKDYKFESEKQAKEIEAQKLLNKTLLERLEALENKTINEPKITETVKFETKEFEQPKKQIAETVKKTARKPVRGRGKTK